MKPSSYEVRGSRVLGWAGVNLDDEARRSLDALLVVLEVDPYEGIDGILPLKPDGLTPNAFSVPFAGGKYLLAYQVTVDFPSVRLIRITSR